MNKIGGALAMLGLLVLASAEMTNKTSAQPRIDHSQEAELEGRSNKHYHWKGFDSDTPKPENSYYPKQGSGQYSKPGREWHPADDYHKSGGAPGRWGEYGSEPRHGYEDHYRDDYGSYGDGQCQGLPPPVGQTTWPDTCEDANVGAICPGTCADGFDGSPKARCKSKKGYGPPMWVVSSTGACTQGARLVLYRTRPKPNIQTETSFFLLAVYTAPAGFPQSGVLITGPVIAAGARSGGLVTCVPEPPAPLTDAFGTATWECTTGTTPGPVDISVSAPNPAKPGTTLTASLSLTIGTDCVGTFGDFGPCSSVCIDKEGFKGKTFNVTTPAANGGRPCLFADGQVVTAPCTGELCCKGAPGLENATVLYEQDFSANADGWIRVGTGGDMVQTNGFTPGFEGSPGVGQVDMPGTCPAPGNTGNQAAECKGPFTRFGQVSGSPYWRNLTQGAPNGFVTQLAMYLDTSATNQLTNDMRIDYSVALNDNSLPNPGFVQDFVFNMGFYDDASTNPGASSRRFIISGSNNANRPGADPANQARSPVAVTAPGWYIFQHKFYPEGNNLYANLTMFAEGNSCGAAPIGTWKLGPAGFPTALTLEQLGFVRYGWLVNVEYPNAANLTVAGQVLATLGAP